MAYRGAPETWVLKVSRAIDLWHAQAQRPASSLPLSPLRAPHYRLYVRQPAIHGFGYLRWKHVQGLRSRGRKGWLGRASQARQRLGLHTSALCLNTSTSRWSAGLSQYMARFRNTLDTVSKAVSAAGTRTELFSKIARLKPNASQLSKEIETSLEVKPKAEETTTTPTLNQPPPIPTVTTSCTPTPTSTVSTAPTRLPAATPDVKTTTSVPNCNAAQETATAAQATATAAQATAAQATATPAAPNVRERGEKKLRRDHASTVKTKVAAKVLDEIKPSSPNGSETNNKGATISKPATTQQLFHPSTFSANLDETYNYLSHHINAYFSSSTTKADEKKVDNNYLSHQIDAYFSSSTKTDEKKVDSGAKSSISSPGQQTSDLVQMSNTLASEPAATSAPSSHKKGIGHYLSYSAPSVQAFVGSYIAPLVPKFRAEESRRAAVSVEEKMSVVVQEKQSAEATVNKEQKAAEEKAKRLLLQREKLRCLPYVLHIRAAQLTTSTIASLFWACRK